jgi:hypothetical protein
MCAHNLNYNEKSLYLLAEANIFILYHCFVKSLLFSFSFQRSE